MRLVPTLYCTITMSIHTVGATPSTWRAPWLDTQMAAAPASTPSTASSLVRIPLSTKGSFVILGTRHISAGEVEHCLMLQNHNNRLWTRKGKDGKSGHWFVPIWFMSGDLRNGSYIDNQNLEFSEWIPFQQWVGFSCTWMTDCLLGEAQAHTFWARPHPPRWGLGQTVMPHTRWSLSLQLKCWCDQTPLDSGSWPSWGRGST